MTTKYYLQVEAVNLDAFVYDTNDISTIRGGSFVLREAIRQHAARFLVKRGFEPVATAASVGLFYYQGELDEDGIIRELMQELESYTQGHATFQAAVEPATGTFEEIRQRLQAKIRRQQMRFPTVRVPAFEPTEQEGYLDGWRPGVVPYRVDPNVKRAKISRATEFRRQEGRRLKQDVFREVLGDGVLTPGQWRVVRDLEELARHRDKGVLDGKMALITLDGNGFGQIRRDRCTTRAKRHAFDQMVQNEVLTPFLQALLHRALNDADFQTQSEGKKALRLEVLLWGGDEITLVVPAWKGLETLALFYDIAREKQFEGAPLTYRSALVFCHHNAPILPMRNLAHQLLDVAKDHIASRASGNAVHYLVLESFDVLGMPLNSFIAQHYHEDGGPVYAHLLLDGENMASLGSNLRQIVRHGSKGRAIDVASMLRSGKLTDVEELTDAFVAAMEPEQQTRVRQAVRAVLAGHPQRWYLISDLWDYAKEWKR